MSMAAAARAATRAPGRAAARFVQTRLRSSGGKVLGEEEKAAENVYIKKMEQEKLEKLARKGPSTGEQAHPHKRCSRGREHWRWRFDRRHPQAGTSTDKNRNYAVLAGTIAGLSAWAGTSCRSFQEDGGGRLMHGSVRPGFTSLLHMMMMIISFPMSPNCMSALLAAF
ncbi:hypothetical protein ZWY2020_054204 [Hordeum vulgare]|nr:hypothetical protein ZWY2020_054204 [Hordeum vulgare]